MPEDADVNEQDFINAVIREDTGAWFETHSKIFGKDRAAGLITPKQNYLQRKIQQVVNRMKELGLPVRVIILKPRQKGSTTYGCALTYTMLRRVPTSAVVIGGQISQCAEAWQMMQTYSKSDTFDWKNTGEINSRTGSWSNGSKLIQETAGDSKAGIGGTHQALHCFETARWGEHGVSNSAEVLTNIMKCIPLLPGTLINLESTAEGQTGAFYSHWTSATDAEAFLDGSVEVKPGSFVRCFASWFEFDDSAIRLTDEQKGEIERTLDAESWYSGEQELIEQYGSFTDDGIQRLGNSVEGFDVWEQLAWRRWSIEVECKKDKTKFERDSPHSWRTAFQKSGNTRFSASGLAKMRERAKQHLGQHGILEETKEGRLVLRSTAPNEAKVIIFEHPIKGCRYIESVDPMTGITQAGGTDPDFHAIYILREGYYGKKGQWHPPATAAKIVKSRWDIPIAEPELFRLAQYYGPKSGCTIVIEMNQDKGFTELLKLRGANLYRREMFNQTEQATTKAYGFVTTEKTRENIVERLAGAIRNCGEDGNGIDIWDVEALDEFDNFVRKRNGRSEAAEGYHDDTIFGIGIGFEVIGHGTTYFPSTTGSWFEPPSERRVQAKSPGAYS